MGRACLLIIANVVASLAARKRKERWKFVVREIERRRTELPGNLCRDIENVSVTEEVSFFPSFTDNERAISNR